MSTELIPPLTAPLQPASLFTPTPTAAKRVLEFFTAQIDNDHTRKAYLNATRRFAVWCDAHGIGQLADVHPFHVAAFVKDLQGEFSPPTVKQHLAALRMLFDMESYDLDGRGKIVNLKQGRKAEVSLLSCSRYKCKLHWTGHVWEGGDRCGRHYSGPMNRPTIWPHTVLSWRTDATLQPRAMYRGFETLSQGHGTTTFGTEEGVPDLYVRGEASYEAHQVWNRQGRPYSR